MSNDAGKKAVAEAALAHVIEGKILGVGTGSTVNFFIEALAASKLKVPAAVSSSLASSALLEKYGIPLLDLNQVDRIGVYIDGADESNPDLALIKGGGGALTREKIIAAVSDRFVCIADDSKLVDVLGAFPLPVEVVPMARGHVKQALTELGGTPVWREGFVTDNGNDILDVAGLQIKDPCELERQINQITGVLTNGLFALRGADVLLLGGPNGVREIGSNTSDE